MVQHMKDQVITHIISLMKYIDIGMVNYLALLFESKHFLFSLSYEGD